jgi:hypothetical protein
MTVTNQPSTTSAADTTANSNSASHSTSGPTDFQRLFLGDAAGPPAASESPPANQPYTDWRRLFASDPNANAAPTPPATSGPPGPYSNPTYNAYYQYQMRSAGQGPAGEIPGAAANPFGDQPFEEGVTGTGPLGQYSIQSVYFPKKEASQQVADMLGGTLVEGYDLSAGPFVQDRPDYRVKLPDGQTINPSDIIRAYMHGYPQVYVDQNISAVLNGATVTMNAIPGHWVVDNGRVSYSQQLLAATTKFTIPAQQNGPVNA